jgi:hypothetical protein
MVFQDYDFLHKVSMRWPNKSVLSLERQKVTAERVQAELRTRQVSLPLYALDKPEVTGSGAGNRQILLAILKMY